LSFSSSPSINSKMLDLDVICVQFQRWKLRKLKNKNSTWHRNVNFIDLCKPLLTKHYRISNVAFNLFICFFHFFFFSCNVRNFLFIQIDTHNNKSITVIRMFWRKRRNYYGAVHLFIFLFSCFSANREIKSCCIS